MSHSDFPATYVNKTICTAGSMVRLIFIDCRNETDEHIRASIALSHEDALETYKLLKRMLVDDKEK